MSSELDYSPLGQLGYCLIERFRAQGKLDDLERAIAANRKALQLVPDEHPSKATRLNNLSSSLRERYERLDTLDDLENAIIMQQLAVELTSRMTIQICL